jgi:hypothetical protein
MKIMLVLKFRPRFGRYTTFKLALVGPIYIQLATLFNPVPTLDFSLFFP